MGLLEFDNDASTTSNDSNVSDNDPRKDMTPTGTDYTCQYVQDGVVQGELSWNHTTHVLKINGTIFFDGDVRFDDNGQVVHYTGRAMIYAAGNVEFDEQVCADGDTASGATPTCVPNNMTNWDPSKNLMVLMSGKNSEYDQGGDFCSAGTVQCPNGHSVTGFQGIVTAQGDCTIHEQFHLSGPVLCKGQLLLPYETDGWPTIEQFPTLGGLIDGLLYVDTATATHFAFEKSAQLTCPTAPCP
jgi:hypothetical protein